MPALLSARWGGSICSADQESESSAYALTESCWWGEWLSSLDTVNHDSEGMETGHRTLYERREDASMWMAGNALENREESIASIACLCWWIVGVIILFSPEMHSNINGKGEGQSLDAPKVDLLAKYKIRGGAWECWSYLVTDLYQP